MALLSAQDLSQACRIFLELAYPAGSASIPVDVRPYLEIAPDGPVADYLPPAPFAEKICQKLNAERDGAMGMTFRLGRAGFRFLKLRLQQIEHHGDERWVFSVDTHDKRLLALPKQSPADIEMLRVVKLENEALKIKIERAFDQANILTPTELLRIDLTVET